MRPIRTLIVSLLLVSLALVQTSCIGRFAVSGKVRKFNLEVTQDKWGREIVFLILYIIPIYPLAGLIDILIINSIEFWTGTNPVDGGERLARAGDQKHVVAADGSEAISTLREDGSIDIEIRTADGGVHFVNVVREAGHVVARDEHGARLARVDSTTAEVQPLLGSEPRLQPSL